MLVLIGMSALGIDVGQWYLKHHQAQVVADAAALAAANCLATSQCTQSSDAVTVADAYAASQVTISNVTINGSSVKVTAQGKVWSSFAALFGIPSVTASANATAGYTTIPGNSWPCASAGSTSCMSLFAGNTTCPAASSTPPTDLGLDLVINDSGGGSSTMSNTYTNGYYYNGASSGTYTVTGPSCGGDSVSKWSNTQFTTTSGPIPYPVVWTKPACTSSNTATSWTTSTVTAPGVYCVTASPSGCTSTSTGTGDINVTLSSLPSGAYEFVGPCVIVNGSNPNVSNIQGQPLVYGTSNITTYATSSSLPTCKLNDGSNGVSTWFVGSNGAVDAPIFDQCGTFDVPVNSTSYTGYVEAWNIVIEKNGSVTGDGPTSSGTTIGTVTTTPAQDSLAG